MNGYGTVGIGERLSKVRRVGDHAWLSLQRLDDRGCLSCSTTNVRESQRDERDDDRHSRNDEPDEWEGSLVVGRQTVVKGVFPCQHGCLRLHSCEFCVEWDGVGSRNGERIMWSL